MVRFAYLLLLLLLLWGTLGEVRGIGFDVPAGSTKCISEEVVKDQLCIGTFSVPVDSATGLSAVALHVTGPQPVSVGGSKTFFSKVHASAGKFAFTAVETGRHRMCFKSTAPVDRRIDIDVKIGVEAKDYSSVAKEEHLKPIEVNLRRLQDMVHEIHEEQLYMRAREEAMRDTNESTNSRLKWFSLTTIMILLSLGTWQILYLKTFFRKSKLLSD
eukprot:g3505.t1